MIKLFYKIAYKILVVYWFIFRPQTYGVKCVVTFNKKILFIKNTYSESNLWNLPGGGIKKGETPEEGILREVKEETGLDLKNLKKIGDYLNNRNYKKDFVYCFSADAETEDTRIDKNEILTADWFDLDNLPINLTESTKDILDMLTSS